MGRWLEVEGLGFRRGKNSTELQLEYISGPDSFVFNSDSKIKISGGGGSTFFSQ